jgi:hypothetical protein
MKIMLEECSHDITSNMAEIQIVELLNETYNSTY